jgi:hypothetical protein
MLSGRSGTEWNTSAPVYADDVNMLGDNTTYHKEKQKPITG